jgi:hypothetical protein
MKVKSEVRSPKSELQRARDLRGDGQWDHLCLRNPIRLAGGFGRLVLRFGFGFVSDFRRKQTGFQIGLMILLTTCLPIRAEDTNSHSRFDIQSFRIISERNIFDPNRSRRSERGERRERERERPVRTESFALVGTMSYEKGWFAFFDGTSADYRKALQPADAIAGYKVADITQDYVKLAANGREVELRVGMQMKRQDEGEWQAGERTESFEHTNTAASATATNETTTSTGPESDILKRLMQKREQELQK